MKGEGVEQEEQRKEGQEEREVGEGEVGERQVGEREVEKWEVGEQEEKREMVEQEVEGRLGQEELGKTRNNKRKEEVLHKEQKVKQEGQGNGVQEQTKVAKVSAQKALKRKEVGTKADVEG